MLRYRRSNAFSIVRNAFTRDEKRRSRRMLRSKVEYRVACRRASVDSSCREKALGPAHGHPRRDDPAVPVHVDPGTSFNRGHTAGREVIVEPDVQDMTVCDADTDPAGNPSV